MWAYDLPLQVVVQGIDLYGCKTSIYKVAAVVIRQHTSHIRYTILNDEKAINKRKLGIIF